MPAEEARMVKARVKEGARTGYRISQDTAGHESAGIGLSVEVREENPDEG